MMRYVDGPWSKMQFCLVQLLISFLVRSLRCVFHGIQIWGEWKTHLGWEREIDTAFSISIWGEDRRESGLIYTQCNAIVFIGCITSRLSSSNFIGLAQDSTCCPLDGPDRIHHVRPPIWATINLLLTRLFSDPPPPFWNKPCSRHNHPYELLFSDTVLLLRTRRHCRSRTSAAAAGSWMWNWDF